MNYNAIFLAHHKTHQTSILHGSSGFGKTATVRAYAQAVNAKLIDKRMSTVDPLTLFLPWLTDDKSTINTALVDWVQAMITCDTHTIIFLDEITNPSSPEVFNVLKELLGERTILGRPISSYIQFIGASNLVEEDTGVKELPDSLWKRATHLAFIPTTSDIVEHLKGSAKTFFSRNSGLLRKPMHPKFPIDAVPRQINACVDLAETGILDDSSLKICCAGKLGTEAGFALAEFIINQRKQKNVFPEVFTRAHSDMLSQYEQEGRALEVVTYLKGDQHVKEDVAYYLATTAMPETARAFHEAKIVLPPVKEALYKLPGGMGWQIYAGKRCALVLGTAS
jgi:hypothetical protein